MQQPCYECRLARHEYCVDVGCVCFTCYADEKEQEPRVWPLREPFVACCELN